MKRIPFYLVLVLFSCTQVKEEPDRRIDLNGKIENSPADFITLLYNLKTDTVKLDEKGSFNHSFETADTGFYYLKMGRNYFPIFIIPGDSLQVNLDAEKINESLVFSGKGYEVNNYLARRAAWEEKNYCDSLYKLDEDRFSSVTDSLLNELQATLKELITKHPDISKFFIRLEEANLLYFWASFHEGYPTLHPYFTNEEKFIPKKPFFNYRDKLNLNDSVLLGSKEYKTYLKDLLSQSVDEKLKDISKEKITDSIYLETQLTIVKELFSDKKVMEYMLFSLLGDEIKYNGIKNIDIPLTNFKKTCSNPDYISRLEESLSKWIPLERGNIAPDFSFPDKDSNMVSLSQFKGKYVYIDVWATWCGPCQYEMPFLQKTEEKLKKKNIIFIGVSVDDSKESWMKMITEKKMKGYQLYAKGWNNPLTKTFLINSIPRFILIDREGKIIDAKAPRPSENIVEIIEKLEGI